MSIAAFLVVLTLIVEEFASERARGFRIFQWSLDVLQYIDM